MLPAPHGMLRGTAVARCVPAFHGVNAPAVAHREIADPDRLGQRRALGRRKDLLVQGNRHAETVEILGQRGGRCEAIDVRIHGGWPGSVGSANGVFGRS